ncbi:MAG: ComEA family DNA-binding protein [Bacteroidetes bacterium]|nr:ComEA family DNA-binding protein [Bacteroidota bacterium]
MWKRILTVAHRLGFTRNETLVLMFLFAVIAAGSIISELRPTPAIGSVDVRSVYRSADTLFAQRSAPRETEQQNGTEPLPEPSAPLTTQARVNLNTAGERELTTLPGIGPATARKILDYRQEHGPFRTVDDLVKVKSIGSKKLQHIRQLITVE